MQIIPLQAIPNQTLQVQLAGQNCAVNVYQLSTGVFVDLYLAGTVIISGVVAQDRNRIVRDAYLGFTGDLSFIDIQGTQDPDYTGLGGRYVLCYLDAFDLAQGEG